MLPFLFVLSEHPRGFCQAFLQCQIHPVASLKATSAANRCLVSRNAVAYTVDFGNEAKNDEDEDERQAREVAKQFILSIMNAEIKYVPNSDDTMSYVEDVVKLETGKTRTIIHRSITTPFWQACINAVNTPNSRVRIAAVGTPVLEKPRRPPCSYKCSSNNAKRWSTGFGR